jgi:predicted deacylase
MSAKGPSSLTWSRFGTRSRYFAVSYEYPPAGSARSSATERTISGILRMLPYAGMARPIT